MTPPAPSESENLLDRIACPDDLRALAPEQLPDVCNELRRFVIDHVAQTGGHLASNLGTVELTVALHYVFHAPHDELVWDTGHQAYAHKVLTGRREAFNTIRQYQGLSGYPSPDESPYDAFPVGHAGTSVSVALGLAKARDLRHGDNHVVAIIGDGGLTSGLALEALNNAQGTQGLLVILNDNEMSISPTIGALASHFSKMVSHPQYLRIKHSIGAALAHVPLVGRFLTNVVMRLQGGLKHVLAPQNVFENMGFHYLGPIDGHDVSDLVEILTSCREETHMPVLLHVLTRKGKGYSPAESNPEKFHGVTPFDCDSGEMHSSATPQYTDLFSEILSAEARRDERITVISAAMCAGIGMQEFARECPERFIDVGIAEQHAVTYAAALAARGLRPVVGIYSTFLQRGYDQIAHDVCMPDLPVVFAVDRAGLVGRDGRTHHGVFDIAYMRHLPNTRIVMPRDGNAMHAAVRYALQQEHPCAVRYGRCAVPAQVVPGGMPAFQGHDITHWQELMNGGDVAICAIGHMVFYAYRAAQLLAERGVAATVVDACMIRPLDTACLETLVTRCGRVVTLEDHALEGGFGASVAAHLLDAGLPAHVMRIGVPDRFIDHGSLSELYAELGWQPEQLAERIATWMRTTDTPAVHHARARE
jgi:1-deoxy-D-xylulose-5-phosphate synthase